MKEVKIVISNRGIYTLVLIGVLIVTSWVVFAFNPSGTGGNPAVMGHSWDEVYCEGCINSTNVQDNAITNEKINSISISKVTIPDASIPWSKISGAPSPSGTVTLTNCEVRIPTADHNVWTYCPNNKVVSGTYRQADGAQRLYCCTISIS